MSKSGKNSKPQLSPKPGFGTPNEGRKSGMEANPELKFQDVREIRGIIFDCDGTLADTMPLHWRAWQVIAERHRLHLAEQRFYELGGVPSRDILKMLSLEQGISLDALAVAREKEAEYLPLIAQVESINTVVGVAREHFGKMPLAVASGGTRRVIEQV